MGQFEYNGKMYDAEFIRTRLDSRNLLPPDEIVLNIEQRGSVLAVIGATTPLYEIPMQALFRTKET